jgi:hypothetical protein
MRVLFTRDFDTLRVKIHYYNIFINLSYRHMSATRICEDSIRMGTAQWSKIAFLTSKFYNSKNEELQCSYFDQR